MGAQEQQEQKKRVRIVLTDTGRGLRQDAALLRDRVIHSGLEAEIVRLVPLGEKRLVWLRRYERLKERLPGGLRYCVNALQRVFLYCKGGAAPYLTIHLENIARGHLHPASQHWLIPNLEWLRMECRQYLPLMDRILCKTQEAVPVMESFHSNVSHCGFSSLQLPPSASDRLDYRKVLHVAGNNQKKGTAAVVSVWRRHPEWPPLHLVIDKHRQPQDCPSNIILYTDIDDQTLADLRRCCGIVLAPSEAEGFGHVLLEGMAWGAVVVTVDAPPMNELVGKSRGFRVAWTETKSCRLGAQYFVDMGDLEKVLLEIWEMKLEDLQQLSFRARAWVENNHQRFIHQIQQLLEQDVKNL